MTCSTFEGFTQIRYPGNSVKLNLGAGPRYDGNLMLKMSVSFLYLLISLDEIKDQFWCLCHRVKGSAVK